MHKKKILIVEDDVKVSQLLRVYLERDGFETKTAVNGRVAVSDAESFKPDLIVLDLNLPEIDGLEVCRKIRSRSRTPIIMLTARDEDTDKIVGLELGADDYITKPFSPREVVARVRAVLRRVVEPLEPTEQVNTRDISIDLSRHEVTYKGVPLSLTPTEFKILTVLAQNPGRVYTRLQLLDLAYGQTWEGYERNIDTHVKNIRQKMSSAATDTGSSLITVHGVGYKYEE
jgi:DNA-binding response OmpR family regulator